MSKIRISVPLYRRTLFEDGWQVTPTPADVIPQDDLYTRQWTDLTAGRDRNQYLLWAQQPLAADNLLSSTSSWTDLTAGRDKHQYGGFQTGPLAADNELAASLLHTTVPAGLDRHTDTSWYQLPLATSNDLAAALLHTGLPELGLRPLRFSYEGWSQVPLAGDNELSSFHVLFDVPLSRDKHNYQGHKQEPLSENFVEPQPLFMPVVDWTAGRDDNTYVGFQAGPLSDPNEMAVRLTQTENPEPDPATEQFDYSGLTLAPLAADNSVSFSAGWTDMPLWRDRYSYRGEQQIPTSEDFSEPMAASRAVTEVPLFKDRTPVKDWSSTPTAADNELAASHSQTEVPLSRDKTPVKDWTVEPTPADNSLSTSSSATEVPLSRDKHSYQGFQAVPLAANNDVAEVRVLGVPLGRDRHSYQGTQQGPVNSEQPQLALISFELPVLGRDFDPQGWQSSGAVPELVVQDTMPTPFFAMPYFGEAELIEHAGLAVMPTPADVVVVPSESVWRPVVRPRRR